MAGLLGVFTFHILVTHIHNNVTESITKMFIEYSRTLFKYRGLHTRLLLYLFTATLTKYLYTLTNFCLLYTSDAADE